MLDILLKNGNIADGRGTEIFRGDVAISDGRICGVRREEEPPLEDGQAAEVIDCTGKLIAPGFIDIHSHGDMTAAAFPEMESYVLQGVTTFFGGQCGMSAAPADRYWRYTFFEDAAFEKIIPPPCGGQIPGRGQLLETEKLRPAFKEVFGFDLDWTHTGEFFDHLEKVGIGVNMLSSVGHGQIRNQVMGTDDRREATQEELGRMEELLEVALENGAAGMSIGLDYGPGVYASDQELMRMARCLARNGRMLTVHCQRRNFRHGEYRKQYYINGLKEALEIGRKTGVRLHISHLACGYEVAPGDPEMEREAARRTLEIIEEYRSLGVDVTWDVIPEGCGGEMFCLPYLASKFQPYVDWCGGFDGFAEKLNTGSYRRQLAEEIERGGHRSVSPFTNLDPVEDPEWGHHVFIKEFCKETFNGRSIHEISEKLGMSDVNGALEILSDDPRTRCVSDRRAHYPGADYYTDRKDASVCIDGGQFNYSWPYEKNRPVIFPAPSTYCGMVKFLKNEIKKGADVSETVAKMTGNSAGKIGLSDRGIIGEGMCGDCVVIDLDELDPRESYTEPESVPSGIDYVIVNGVIEADHGRALHRKAGKILRAPF